MFLFKKFPNNGLIIDSVVIFYCMPKFMRDICAIISSRRMMILMYIIFISCF